MRRALEWTLVEYAWDPNTGIAELTYERECAETGKLETKQEKKAQPTAPHHVGWHIKLAQGMRFD